MSRQRFSDSCHGYETYFRILLDEMCHAAPSSTLIWLMNVVHPFFSILPVISSIPYWFSLSSLSKTLSAIKFSTCEKFDSEYCRQSPLDLEILIAKNIFHLSSQSFWYRRLNQWKKREPFSYTARRTVPLQRSFHTNTFFDGKKFRSRSTLRLKRYKVM